jgi:hypothetical protein
MANTLLLSGYTPTATRSCATFARISHNPMSMALMARVVKPRRPMQ